jgi:hypothetical protein
VDLAYGARDAPQAVRPAVILHIAKDAVCWNVVEPCLSSFERSWGNFRYLPMKPDEHVGRIFVFFEQILA